MSHHISIVDDHELPTGHDFVFVKHRDGAHIFYRRGTLDECVLEDSWAAYRALLGKGGPTVPTRVIERMGEVVDFVRRAV